LAGHAATVGIFVRPFGAFPYVDRAILLSIFAAQWERESPGRASGRF
jgi:hypothetical protein